MPETSRDAITPRSMRSIFLLLLACFLAVGARAEEIDQLGRPVDPALISGPQVRMKVDLSGAKDSVKIVQLNDGSIAYVIKRLGSGSDRLVTPSEFARLYYDQQTEEHGWFGNILHFLFNTTSPIGIAWVSLGLAGQVIFMGRMLVQWFVSEKSKRSVIPVSFWWMSLIGSTMLLVYFIWRRDIVGILGNLTGWIVYVRNLVLIRRSRS